MKKHNNNSNKKYILSLTGVPIAEERYRKSLADLAELLYIYSRQPRPTNPSIESESAT